MPPVQNYKHLLVIVDHLTHWVETFSTRKETAEVVARIILENIIPPYGLVSNIDSDRGQHFITQILHKIIEALGIKWRLRTPWHPQSSERAERLNKTTKKCVDKINCRNANELAQMFTSRPFMDQDETSIRRGGLSL